MLRLLRVTTPLVMLTGVVLLAPAPVRAATGEELRLSFDSGETLATGSSVVDASGHGHNGKVLSGFGGSLSAVQGWNGTTSARYPTPCSAATCPKAMIRVPDAPGLDLDYAPLEWGARLRLDASSTSSGQNLVQKGLYGDATGQWKLQVDGNPGKPSCVVSGMRTDGTRGRVVVYSSVTVATGTWHEVLCRRTSTAVSIMVDGAVQGSKKMRPVRLTGTAPVAIGGKQVSNQDNDQFWGVLDDVVMRRL